MHTLRIERSANGEVILALSGRMSGENVGELEKILKTEAAGHRIVLDLKDLTLVDRDAVRFLSHCEADSIKLKNCPAYIREWMERERDGIQPGSAHYRVGLEKTRKES